MEKGETINRKGINLEGRTSIFYEDDFNIDPSSDPTKLVFSRIPTHSISSRALLRETIREKGGDSFQAFLLRTTQ